LRSVSKDGRTHQLIVVNLSRLLSGREPDILDEHEQMPSVDRRRRKTKMPVERSGLVVLGMHRKRPHTDHIRDLERTPERIKQQPGTDTTTLCTNVDREAREHQQRDRMPGHTLDDALGSLRMRNLPGNDGVESDDLAVAQRDIGLR